MGSTKDQTQEWIAATQKGDLAWFDQFYLKNKPLFLNWASKEFSLSEEELKDVFQHAVIIFYENLLDGKLNQLSSSISTYLFGIGKNLLLKRINKMEVEFRHFDRLKEHWLFDDHEVPDQTNMINWVQKELINLKEPCQSILEMFYLQNLSLETITKKLDYRSSDVVKTQKSRCLRKLRTKLSKFWNTQNNI